jgi:hypothetical protein
VLILDGGEHMKRRKFMTLLGSAAVAGFSPRGTHARWDGAMTRLTTMAAMPASTALAIGDFRILPWRE